MKNREQKVNNNIYKYANKINEFLNGYYELKNDNTTFNLKELDKEKVKLDILKTLTSKFLGVARDEDESFIFELLTDIKINLYEVQEEIEKILKQEDNPDKIQAKLVEKYLNKFQEIQNGYIEKIKGRKINYKYNINNYINILNELSRITNNNILSDCSRKIKEEYFLFNKYLKEIIENINNKEYLEEPWDIIDDIDNTIQRIDRMRKLSRKIKKEYIEILSKHFLENENKKNINNKEKYRHQSKLKYF